MLICNFLLDIQDSHQTGKDKLKTWYDFVIKKEHLFIMNIYSQEEVSSTDNISDISNYYEQFSRFIKIVIQLENCFSNFRMKESLHLEELPHNDMDDELSQ